MSPSQSVSITRSDDHHPQLPGSLCSTTARGTSGRNRGCLASLPGRRPGPHSLTEGHERWGHHCKGRVPPEPCDPTAFVHSNLDTIIGFSEDAAIVAASA